MNAPLDSLRSHCWFKLICGASYQHLPAIRNLALVYTLAGADCIDTAPDPATIAAVREGIDVAQSLVNEARHPRPWLMVSYNDGEDPHFRKAEFDPSTCPPDCDRPCEAICPTRAIRFTAEGQGVRDSLCYGCGRCLPVCPVQHIRTREQVYVPEAIAAESIDAIEIHTQPGRVNEFRNLWQRLQGVIPKLQVVAVSCPDSDDLKTYLMALLACMEPPARQLIWQTDGRPMSGDIGGGATRAALLLGRKVLDFDLPTGFVQVAGGTNDRTVPGLRAAGIDVAGVAYGSYARSLVADLLDRGGDRLEDHPELLRQSVSRAKNLVSQIKEQFSLFVMKQ